MDFGVVVATAFITTIIFVGVVAYNCMTAMKGVGSEN
jgi:hypothetical protein